MSKSKKDYWLISFVLEMIINNTLEKLDSYEIKIRNNEELKIEIPDIARVYMESIVLDFAKIISAGNNDQCGIKQLKQYAPTDIKSSIEDLELKHKGLFEKVRTNRHKLIAHVDIGERPYFELGFSEQEIERKVEDFKKALSLRGESTSFQPEMVEHIRKLRSTSKETERFNIADFNDEIQHIKEVITEIKEITEKLNQHLYSSVK